MSENIQKPRTHSIYTIHHVLGRVAGRLICSLALTDPKVFGAENLNELPRPYLVVMNHCSSWDPVLIWGYYPDTLNFMTKIELHRIPWFSPMSELAGNIPVNRDILDFGALKHSLKHLKAGLNLGVFAEGSRSIDGLVQPFKQGVISLACKARVPIVPVYLHGTFEVCSKDKLFPKACQTSIHILPPRLKTIEGNLEREELEKLTLEIQKAISEKQQEIMGLRK
ncbi:1-acyl-sn-glycerol-3-phosphate acyltransferase [bacterium]|jgi:1-acyl-sn-glycerol-3-phosphate acyltransferase|nr:1-acyl-sn-glycerol-3-phosphate acyltransferase [bacterium]